MGELWLLRSSADDAVAIISKDIIALDIVIDVVSPFNVATHPLSHLLSLFAVISFGFSISYEV